MRWLSLFAVLTFAAPALADPLDGITIAPEVNAEYDRDAMYGDWAEENCVDTRAKVLTAESLVLVTFNEAGCSVIEGLWYDPFPAPGIVYGPAPPRVVKLGGVFSCRNVRSRGLSGRANDLAGTGKRCQKATSSSKLSNASGSVSCSVRETLHGI